MSEKKLRDWFREEVVRARGFYQRHEDRVSDGIADISFALPAGRYTAPLTGWIEAKWLPRWPVRGGFVNVGLRPGQVLWLGLRDKVSNDAKMMLGVGDELLFFDGAQLPSSKFLMRHDVEAQAALRFAHRDHFSFEALGTLIR